MSDTILNAPFGYKWVIRYKQKDGQLGMGITTHHFGLSDMLSQLVSMGARDIVITDETFYKDDESFLNH